ncbi:uncharacterized protein LOC119549456 [Drosophila subpulchrella]|uniref:uncharacterized protein LOC119549456 n=1 Tax=Drosophila subpulchrella TaxID=1486046 RepID=UPI0018A1A8B5|nr:uncharacterized protein LOC119549456 [Drosophila subpulchrella]
MECRFFVRNFVLFGLIASSQLRIVVKEVENNLDNEINSFFQMINTLEGVMGFYCVITYTGKVDLSSSLQQRIMEAFPLPIYTVGSDLGPVNHHYLSAQNMVVALFTGLDDPTLAALDDTELRFGKVFVILIYAPPPNAKNTFNMDFIHELFSWCWGRSLDRVALIARGKYETELWSFYHLEKLRPFQTENPRMFLLTLRRDDYTFILQAVNDPPTIFWYNSSEQADVTNGGNISLSGPIGLMMVNFMRFLNVTMEIIPVPGQQTSQYEIFHQTDGRRVDVVANMVDDNNLKFSPVLSDLRLCVLVSNRRTIPVSKYIGRVISPGVHQIAILTSCVVFMIKYLSHGRRSLLDPFFNTLRFNLAFPLADFHLNRLPIADKFIEVFSFFFISLIVSSIISMLSTVFTTGIFEPAITNAETLRASGLKIMTDDPTIPQAFKDDILPSSLADRVILVDFPTLFHHIISLNDSYAYVVKTPNWNSFRLYQQRMKSETLRIVGGELCSKSRPLRMPIHPRSPIRFFFQYYFEKIFESGLSQKWREMGFQKYREIKSLQKLPIDHDMISRPLTIEFFKSFILLYIGGMALSTLVFIIELLLNRYTH